MIKSMTGYGRYESTLDNYKVLIEMRSVNHRFNEISMKLPRNLLPFEDKFKRIIQKKIRRGRIDVYITMPSDHVNQKNLVFDKELITAYRTSIQQVKNDYQVAGELSVSDLLHIPDLFRIEEEEIDVHQMSDLLFHAVEQATDILYLMRNEEGLALSKDLLERVEQIKSVLAQLRQLTPKVQEHYKERLEARVREFLEGKAELDESRLLSEVAIFAERSNIDEELTRLDSHCHQFIQGLQNEEPVGRKLDFIVQEMNREVNTIGSKAHDITISQFVVDLKSEIEKIKEQVQNIE